jgi:hypothetical protein
MAKHATQETVGFNGFHGYYGSMSAGYGGFTWLDVDYMNATYWQNQQTQWCDTGFQNVIRGAGDAFTWSTNGTTSHGLFETSNTKETFDVKSMVAASAWETDQPFYFNSYTYAKGYGFSLKDSVTIDLSQTRQTINFSKIGNPGGFKDIAAVEIISGSGKYGNTCSYGRYGYTLGNEMAFDNLKVKWNGKIPKGHGKLITTGLGNHEHGRAHSPAAHLVSGDAHHDPSPASHGVAAGQSGTQSGFHSELLFLGDVHPGTLTGQFQLPASDHFGV